MKNTTVSKQYDIIIEIQIASIRELYPPQEAEKLIAEVLKKVQKRSPNENT